MTAQAEGPYRCLCPTPLGVVRITADERGICSLRFAEGEAPEAEEAEGPHLAEARVQLAEYFAGKRRDFDLPLSLRGSTFQRRVWAALRAIPYGERRSYQDIARAVGNEKACRAVGMANNRNPVALLIPCHRVTGKDGSLTGYAGGLWRKKALLELEAAHRAENRPM